MRYLTFWVCLAALSMTTAAARAETYTIKLKHAPDVDKSVVVKDTDTKTQVNKVSDADGNVIKDEKHTETTFEEYTETVLAKGAKFPTKYKRTYEKATRTRDGKATTRSYEGRTLLFEKKDDKFIVIAEGDKPLDKNDLEELTKKANEREEDKDDLLLPKKPVAVGDTWKIDTKDLIRSFGKETNLDPDTTSAEAKLVKAYRKDGSQFGEIVMTMKLGFKFPKEVKFEKAPVLEMKMTLNAAIDGSTPAGVMTSTGGATSVLGVEQGGKKFKIDSRQELSGKKEQSREK